MLALWPYLKNYDHIIWDWNGTLLSDLDHAVTTVNTLLQRRNLPLLDETSYKENFHFPIRSYYETIGFDLQTESFESLCEEFVSLFMDGVFDCPLVPGAREILTQVKQNGKIQSILSASDQNNLDRMIVHFQLTPHVDHVFGIADKMAASKIYRGQELLDITKTSPSRCLLVGDTDHDLEVGQHLNIPVLLVAHGHQDERRLRRLHPHVVDVENLAL